VNLLATLSGASQASIALAADAGETAGAGLQINFFWVIVATLNFLIFAVLLYLLFGRSVSQMLQDRRRRIAQGLEDAEQARQDRERAEADRLATLKEARRESKEILDRSQRLAQETRDADIAATKAELERLREQAASEIEAEKQRALAELRTEVADLALAAASKVLGEEITGERQRRLVEDFLSETASPGSSS
jgi:F-type H+-transporting ATPase subunit b